MPRDLHQFAQRLSDSGSALELTAKIGLAKINPVFLLALTRPLCWLRRAAIARPATAVVVAPTTAGEQPTLDSLLEVSVAPHYALHRGKLPGGAEDPPICGKWLELLGRFGLGLCRAALGWLDLGAPSPRRPWWPRWPLWPLPPGPKGDRNMLRPTPKPSSEPSCHGGALLSTHGAGVTPFQP